MYLHAAVPAFHAAIHQAAEPSLRDRPLVIASDAGPQARCLAVSTQAQDLGLRVGDLVGEARRRDRHLAVVQARPEWYERAQGALVDLLRTASPRLGGEAGAIDVDLEAGHRLWCLKGDRDLSAQHLAQGLRRQVADHLGLDLRCGLAPQRRLARLATLLGSGVQRLDHSDARLADISLADWTDLAPQVRQRCADLGLRTLGQARALGIATLSEVAGLAGAPLVALSLGEDDPHLPGLDEGDLALAVSRSADPEGGDAAEAQTLVRSAVAELADRLDRANLAATTLTLIGLQGEDRLVRRSHSGERQLRTRADLDQIASHLLARCSRRAPWRALRLRLGGLCTAEAQQSLFDLPVDAETALSAA